MCDEHLLYHVYGTGMFLGHATNDVGREVDVGRNDESE